MNRLCGPFLLAALLVAPVAHAQVVLASREQAMNSMQEDRTPTGDWVYRDGVHVCDGYFTRNRSEGHCAQQAPSDWQAFEFHGETYYIQRLTGSD